MGSTDAATVVLCCFFFLHRENFFFLALPCLGELKRERSVQIPISWSWHEGFMFKCSSITLAYWQYFSLGFALSPAAVVAAFYHFAGKKTCGVEGKKQYIVWAGGRGREEEEKVRSEQRKWNERERESENCQGSAAVSEQSVHCTCSAEKDSGRLSIFRFFILPPLLCSGNISSLYLISYLRNLTKDRPDLCRSLRAMENK